AVRYALGLALLLGPLAIVGLTGATQGDGSRRRRVTEYVRSRGLGPWLWFLAAYTVLVALQRWGIDREVIARYWLPYWIVGAVLVGRCVADWTVRPGRAWLSSVVAAWVSLVALAGYNTAQVATTARSNANDGITLNAVRYQESDLLGSLSRGQLSVVYADDTYLVSFQAYARGALVPVERLRCRVELLDSFVASLRADSRRGEVAAVAIVGRCRDTQFVEELLNRLDGARVEREPGVGVVVWPDG
ncbi:MAG: hypothetical protein Q8K72_22085, partial [Acidimicrobiales bacterium]|nr:hypothetical protein [Acidimicrobiales bacterium]